MSGLGERIAAALAASAGRGADAAARDLRFTELTAPPETPAAVLIALTDRTEPGVLLTQRTESLRRHAGQVAFPGGRVDPADVDVIAAALREAWEETALAPSAVDVIGTLDPFRLGTGFHVTPVIGVIPPDLPLVPQPDEVSAIFEVPLAHLLDAANHLPRTGVFAGIERHYIEIPWPGRRIWGATAAIIAELAARIGPWP